MYLQQKQKRKQGIELGQAAGHQHPGCQGRRCQAVAGGAVSSARPHMNPPCMRFLGSPVEYPLK